MTWKKQIDNIEVKTIDVGMLYTFTTQILVTSDEGETCKNPFMNYCGSSTEKIIKVVVVVVNQNRQFERIWNCELLIQKKMESSLLVKYITD